MTEYKKQHYVPKVYQSGFLDSKSVGVKNIKPFVWRLDVKTGQIDRKAPKNILFEPYLYSQYDVFDNRQDNLEKYFSEIENGFRPFIEKFEKPIIALDQTYVTNKLTSNDKLWLCKFIFWQFKRTKYFVNQTYKRLEEEINKFPPSDIERALIEKYKLMQTNAIETVKFAGNNTNRDIIKMLMGRCIYIMVITNKEPAFVSSDNPVYFANPFRPPGLKYEETEIGLPFTSKIAIGIRDTGSHIHLIPVSDRAKIRRWNLDIARTAHEYVIGPNESLLRRLYRELPSAKKIP